ncbi:MAG: EAL domain-containing protein [Deltaproteobacteria bacterium]|nr:EAL domain-containing protein [Deltaproteobacteria bacterium]
MGARILLVDDEPVILRSLERLLTNHGHQVVVAADGEEALRVARQSIPDLILSDVRMPNMDGHELLAALQGDATLARIPFIFLTAHSEPDSVRLGMGLGADDFLSKPVLPNDLLAAVNTRLEKAARAHDEARRLEQHARFLEHHDPLTGLSNRALLLYQVELLMRGERGTRDGVVIVCVGLDRFTHINDTFGGRAGDDVLCQAARRLLELVAGDQGAGPELVARLGNDLFAVAMPARGGVTACVERSRAALARPYRVGTQETFVSACVGAAVFPADATRADALLLCAETALRSAKTEGPGHAAYFSPVLNADASRRVRLRDDLRRALGTPQLELHYQPQIDISSGRMVGAEALLRWTHPAEGPQPPGEFIPRCEDDGLILPVGEWVVGAGCIQAKQWLDAGTPLRVSVNVSPRQLWDQDVVAVVRQALEKTGLPAQWLELEITETATVRGMERIMPQLLRLREMGVLLSLDDFGTGYSSLNHLRRLPVTGVKVDQGFVRGMLTDAGDAAIARAVVELGKSFHLGVVAEGVETAEQAAAMRALGCEVMQGYFYGRPVPARELRPPRRAV